MLKAGLVPFESYEMPSELHRPAASAAAVARLFEGLRSSLPDLNPRSHKNLSYMLNSVHGTTPGRQRRLTAAGRCAILTDNSCAWTLNFTSCSRETSISVRSLIDQYLCVLNFPRDIQEALEQWDLNLFKAHQFARLTAKRLKMVSLISVYFQEKNTIDGTFIFEYSPPP
jgi:hypothetical protein